MKILFVIIIGFLFCGCSTTLDSYSQPYYMTPKPSDVGSPPIFRPGYSGPFF